MRRERLCVPIPSETDSWSGVLLSFDVVSANMHHKEEFVHHELSVIVCKQQLFHPPQYLDAPITLSDCCHPLAPEVKL